MPIPDLRLSIEKPACPNSQICRQGDGSRKPAVFKPV